MVRKLALSLAVASAIAAGQANALGLGEIRVNSALNEPLDADIRLVQVRDLTPLQIMPRMADVDEFSLAGLSKSRFLSDVKFQVKIEPDGSGSIHVTSSVPVQEPFLSFLMEVNWPNGRLVREYTLLLDPPVFDPAPVTTAVNAPTAVAPAAPQPAPAPRSESKAAPANNIKSNMGGGEVFVNNNDTLYVLAKNNRPASDISIEQMMIAMQRKNPQIFPTGNINVMRAGKVMQLPTAEEARALTRKQAIAEAARQTAEWKASRRAASTKKAEPAPAPAPEPVEETASGSSEGAPDAAESQLKIVTAEPAAETQQEVSSEAAPDQAAEQTEAAAEPSVDQGPSEREKELIQRNAELEDRLLMTQESVDKVSRENADMGEKLDSIQEQLMAMQRLIELKDQQMAALQAEMLKQAQEANKPKPSAVDDFINMLMANPMYLGGAGGLLVLLLALMALARRRKSNDYDEEPAPRKKKKSKKAEPETDEIPEFEEPQAPAASVASAAPAVAATAAAAAVAAGGMNAAQADASDELDDELDDLDLDMDLDLDEGGEATYEPEEPPAPIDPSELDMDESDSEIDSVLDDILNDDTSIDAGEIDDLDALLDEDADVDTDIDDLMRAEDELVEDDDIEDDELEGLAFAIDDNEGEAEVADETEEMIDDEFFSEEVEAESDQVAATPDTDDAELIDEPMELDDSADKGLDTLAPVEDIDDLVDDDLDAMLMESAAELESQGPAIQVASVVEADTSEPSEDDFELDFNVDMPDADDESEEPAAVAEEPAAAPATPAAAADEDDEDLDLDFNVVKPTADDEFESALIDDALEVGLDSDEEESLDFNIDLDDDLDSELEADLDAGSDLEAELELPESELPATPVAEEQSDELDELEEFDMDLDSMISGLDSEAAIDEPERPKKPGEIVEDELTANIAHDLDLTLDDEIDEMLSLDEGDIELVEEGDEDLGDDDDAFDLLDGADEVETKLDLARAYIEMDDTDGARDILEEIIRDGSAEQQAEAQSLLDKMS